MAAVLSFIHSFSYLPGIDATILRSEADADFEDLAFVISKPAGIDLFLNLLKGGLGVPASDITGHSGNKCIGRFRLNRSIEIQKVVQKTVLDFFVREADLIEFIIFVVILDGQIA